MTNKEILFAAVNKASDKGYPGFDVEYYDFNGSIWYMDNGMEYEDKAEIYIRNIIFDHSFAKAFWGEEEVDDTGRTIIEAWEEEWKDSGHFTDLEDYQFDSDIDFQIAWMYHLRQMVLSNQPLKYLEKYL